MTDRQAYNRLAKAADRAMKKLDAARVVMQLRCKHPRRSIVEGEYHPGTYLGSTPPFRVCKRCGYAEEGWGAGYSFLAPGVYSGIPELDRDEAYEHVIGGVYDNADHCEVRLGRMKRADLLRGARRG